MFTRFRSAALLVLLACARGATVVQPTASATVTRQDGDTREGFVVVPGGRVFYRMFGASRSGIPLLAAHGGPGGTGCNFERLAPLADERPVIYYDQLGTGRSDRPTDTTLWTAARYAEEMEAVRKGLALDRVHLMGSSWGSALVAEYLFSGTRTGVQSVVFGSPLLSTPRWIADADSLRATLPASVRATLDRHEAARTYDAAEYLAATDSFYARFVRRLPVQPLPQCAGVSGNRAIYRQMWGPTEFTSDGNLRTWSRTQQLPDLMMPVLFIAGQYDEARPTTLFEFQRTMRQAIVVTIPGAAHAALAERPAEYVAQLRTFLRMADRWVP